MSVYQPIVNKKKNSERQQAALVVAGVVGVAMPLVAIVALLFTAAWMKIIGQHNIEMRLCGGWLFSHHHGYYVYDSNSRWWESGNNEPNINVGRFYLGILTLWLMYQAGEGTAWAYRKFRDAL